MVPLPSFKPPCQMADALRFIFASYVWPDREFAPAGTGYRPFRLASSGGLPGATASVGMGAGAFWSVPPASLCCNARMQNAVLAFVDDIYEDLELWYPKLRLEEAGYSVRLAAREIKAYSGKHGYPATADLLLDDARSADFAGLLVPGGFMPDKLRRDAKVLALTREFFEQGKLVAFICHGGWIPVSAKILKGRRATGSLGIKDDLENAGAT